MTLHPILSYGTLASLDPKGFPLKTRPLGVFSLDQSWQVRSSLSEAAHAERPHFGSPPKRPSLSPFKKKSLWNFKDNDTIPILPCQQKEMEKNKPHFATLTTPPAPQPLLQAVMTALPQDEEDLPQSPFAGQLSPIGA